MISNILNRKQSSVKLICKMQAKLQLSIPARQNTPSNKYVLQLKYSTKPSCKQTAWPDQNKAPLKHVNFLVSVHTCLTFYLHAVL